MAIGNYESIDLEGATRRTNLESLANGFAIAEEASIELEPFRRIPGDEPWACILVNPLGEAEQYRWRGAIDVDQCAHINRAGIERELKALIEDAGFEVAGVGCTVRTYADDESGQAWTKYVFTIHVPGASRRDRADLMDKLLDLIGDHNDRAVRDNVSVRLR